MNLSVLVGLTIYSSLPLSGASAGQAGAINDIGIPDTGVPATSSGNIIAIPVPEVGTAALVALGVTGLAVRRRARS